MHNAQNVGAKKEIFPQLHVQINWSWADPNPYVRNASVSRDLTKSKRGGAWSFENGFL